MMGSFLRKYVIIILALTLYAPASGHAFSFGDIEVKSAFGEKFEAVIELNVQGTGLLDVSLGRKQEYKLLQLPRASVVDELRVSQPVQVGNRKVIRLVSDKPLFFPSFHLVMRASHDGDTIFKDYLVRVDFQQSLALNHHKKDRSRSKDKNSKEPLEKEKDSSQISADLDAPIQEGENHSEDGVIPQQDRNKGAGDEFLLVSAPSDFAIDPAVPAGRRKLLTPSSGATWVSIRNMASLSGDFSTEEEKAESPKVVDETAKAPVAAEVKESLAQQKAPHHFESESVPPTAKLANVDERVAPPAEMIPPLSRMEAGENLYSDRRLQALISSGDQYAIRSPTKLEAAGVDKGEGPFTEEFYSGGLISGESQAVHKGQTLFAIAREVSLSEYSPAKIAAALWLENQEKFIHGNINGIKVGTRFNLAGLMDRLAILDDQTTSAILRNQWREWKILRQGKPFLEEESNHTIEEYAPPSQQVPDKEKLFMALEDWKNTWEEGDFDGHIRHYYESASLGHGVDQQSLVSQKKKLFKRYQGVRLDVGRSHMMVRGGKVWVTFPQHFSSQSMDSLGRKDLQMVRESGEWKIRNERFKLESFLEKDSLSVVNVAIPPMGIDTDNVASPYVIHVTTYLTQEEARQTIDKLRNAGYDAYLATLRVSRSKRIYRVYVGRYSNWDIAREIATELRNHRYGENAIPSPHPWVIQVGNFLSADDAEEKLDSMRILGFSPFLFSVSEADFSFPMFRVYLGAFIKKNQARQMMEDLKILEISHTLVTP